MWRKGVLEPGLEQVPNYSIKDEIAAYWSNRARTFDASPGHGIRGTGQVTAWNAALRRHLGASDQRVLELGAGTGEITRLLCGLGHRVTAVDIAEGMLDRCRAKLKQEVDRGRLNVVLGDAEHPMVEGPFDAIVCRHLLWTLPDPRGSAERWLQLLRPGGTILIFDGLWYRNTLVSRILIRLAASARRVAPGDIPSIPADAYRNIQAALPYRKGFERAQDIADLLAACGFRDISVHGLKRVLAAECRSEPLHYALGAIARPRFLVHAIRGAQ